MHSRPRRLIPLLLVGLTACSFATLKRVPGDYSKGDELECTSELSSPLIDMSATVLSGLLAISLLSAEPGSREKELDTAGYTALALSLGLGASAVYGAFQVNRCRRARREAGIVPPSTRGPLEDRVPPGTRGGACKEDGSCNEDLVCDPMQTCVPKPGLGD